MNDAMAAEFDTMAEWTAEACVRLGPDFYLPAACRGSGSPRALEWLMDRLDLADGRTLLDSGAGTGGPAGFAARERHARPMLVEPEAGACRAATRLFGLPVVRGSGAALPVRDGAVDACWSLGVLCTLDEQLDYLRELRRVVRTGGTVGLLVLVAHRDISPDEQPEGNQFPTLDVLHDLVDRAGLELLDERDAADLGDPPPEWTDRAERVEDEVAARHRDDDAWQVAQHQSELMGSLIGEGAVGTVVAALRSRRRERP